MVFINLFLWKVSENHTEKVRFDDGCLRGYYLLLLLFALFAFCVGVQGGRNPFAFLFWRAFCLGVFVGNRLLEERLFCLFLYCFC